MEDDTKMKPIVVHASKKSPASVYAIYLSVSLLILIFVPHIIGLALGHVQVESMHAAPKTTDLPERVIYQTLSAFVIYLIILVGVTRYRTVKTICQLHQLGKFWTFLNNFSSVSLAIGVISFFLNTNLTAPVFQKASFVTSFAIYGGFLFHFLAQIPISFKMLPTCGSNNVIGFRLILLLAQMISWIAEVLVKEVCLHNFEKLFNCAEYMNKNATLLGSWILAISLSLQFLLYYWDFKNIWIDVRIYNKKTNASENNTTVRFDCPRYSSLLWVPVFLILFMILSVMTPLVTLLVTYDIHDLPHFPSISPDGPDTPVADLYSMMTTTSFLIGYIFVGYHHAMIRQNYKTTSKLLLSFNYSSLMFGIFMFNGFQLSGIILFNQNVHIFGASLFFTCSALYMLTTTCMYHMVKTPTYTPPGNTSRKILTVFAWLCLAVIIITKVLAMKKPESLAKAGNLQHGLLEFLCNVFEWLMMIFVVPFFCTFVCDFKNSYINLTPSINNTILDDKIAYVIAADIDHGSNTSAV